MNQFKQRVLIVASQNGYEQIYKIPFELLQDWAYDFRAVREHELKPVDVGETDYLILYRCTTGPVLSLARLAKAKEIPVIYELDDDLLSIPEDEDWGKRCVDRGLSWITGLFLQEADIIKAGSPELAKRLEKRGYSAVYQPYPVRFIEKEVEASGASSKIGYFGTRHHQSDISAIVPALETVQRLLNGQVHFEFIGCCPQDISRLKNAKVFPPVVGYECFLNFLAGRNWDLGLAPLHGTSFNQAKSDSKFRDLTGAGIAGIYSAVLPYRECIIDGWNGWLCGDSCDAWAEAIIAGLKSPRRLSMVSSARRQLQQENNPGKIAQNWDFLLKSVRTIKKEVN
jgi:hypothetical protein